MLIGHFVSNTQLIILCVGSQSLILFSLSSPSHNKDGRSDQPEPANQGRSYSWTWGAVAPPQIFKKKFQYIYSILFLAICFNKITLAPLNNIIDIFKCYKKNISPPIKIKPKQHKKKKKIRAGFNEISTQSRSRKHPTYKREKKEGDF